MRERHIVPERQERLSPFEKEVLSDYKLSYHHSQGSENLQGEMFVLLSTSYAPSPSLPFSKLYSSIQETVEQLDVPAKHPIVFKEDVAKEFTLRWKLFSEAIGHTIYDLPLRSNELRKNFKDYRKDPEHFHARVLTSMCSLDDSYQQNGREQRQTHTQRYQSFIRKHAVENISTGNPKYDALYLRIRDLIGQTGTQKPEYSEFYWYLKSLINHWEENHPDEKFIQRD